MAKSGGKNFRKNAQNTLKNKAKRKESDIDHAARLARFGLKSAEDTKEFDKTEAGEISNNILEARIAELEQARELQLITGEELQQKQTELLSLRLALSVDTEKATHLMNQQYTLLDLNRRLQVSETVPKRIDIEADLRLVKALEDSIRSYDEADKELQKEINKLEKELDVTLKELNAQEAKLTQQTERANVIDKFLANEDNYDSDESIVHQEDSTADSMPDEVASFFSSLADEMAEFLEEDDELLKDVQSAHEKSKDDKEQGLEEYKNLRPKFADIRDKLSDKRSERDRMQQAANQALLERARSQQDRMKLLVNKKQDIGQLRQKAEAQLKDVHAAQNKQGKKRENRLGQRSGASRNAALSSLDDLSGKQPKEKQKGERAGQKKQRRQEGPSSAQLS